MKKLCSLLLACVLALSCAACAGNAETTSIVLWHSMSDEAGVLMADYVRQFNETIGKEKGIAVEAVYQGAYVDATTKMNNMLSAGQISMLPDVMQLDSTGKVNYAASGVAYTVDQAMADDETLHLDDYLPAAVQNWHFAGAQLGLPFATSTTVMYYNKTVLDEIWLENASGEGVDAYTQNANFSAPASLAEIAQLADQLNGRTAPDGSALTLYAAIPNTPTLANWLGQMGSYVVDKENGNEGSAETLACVESGALERFLTAWKQMYETGALKNEQGSLDGFIAGQQLLFTDSSSKLSGILEKVGDRFQVGVAYFPKSEPEAAFGATPSGSCLVMFDKQDENKKAAARELVKFLTGAQVQANLAMHTGYVPANQAAAQEAEYQQFLEAQPRYGIAFMQLLETPASMRSVTVGPAKDFYYAIQNNVSDMLDSDLTPKETAEYMQEELSSLLWQYNQANP